MEKITHLYRSCPDCVCKRDEFLETDIFGEVYKPMLLTGLSLKNLVASIEGVSTETDFLMMRHELEKQYGVKFLIPSKKSIQIHESIPGLCKRSRQKIQDALDLFNPLFLEKILIINIGLETDLID